jgi:hypothetical protein
MLTQLDPPLSFRLGHSLSRMKLPMSHSHSMLSPTPNLALQSTHHHSPRSSSNRSTPRLTCFEYARSNQNGTWICSILAVSPGKTHIHTSGSSTPGCPNGFKTCHRARYQLSGPSSSSNFSTVMSTSCHQAQGYRTSTNMHSA